MRSVTYEHYSQAASRTFIRTVEGHDFFVNYDKQILIINENGKRITVPLSRVYNITDED